MYSVFNSTFENSLRVLILLDAAGTALSLERVYIADFIATYGRAFGITKESLNGENQFMYSELASRREQVRSALKELALEGYVIPLKTDKGFSYQVDEAGRSFSISLESEYAKEYRRAAKAALSYMENRTHQSITEEITVMSMRSIQRKIRS